MHGFTVGKNSPAASRICRQLAALGIGMLRFDALGVGESEGEWGDGSFSTKVADTVQALGFLADRGTPAGLLVGHSWGGAAAVAAASAVPSVAAVATIAAPSDPSHVQHHVAGIIERVTVEGSVPWAVGRRTLTVTRPFIEDIARSHILGDVAELGRPLLVVHSPDDATVSLAHASELFLAAAHPFDFVSSEAALDVVVAARARGWMAAW